MSKKSLTSGAIGFGVLLAIAWVRVANNRFGLATTLVILVLTGVAFVGLLEALMRLSRISGQRRGSFRLLAATLVVIVFGVEGFLRLATTRYTTYPELNGLPYQSVYRSVPPTWFHVHQRAGLLTERKAEFTHSRSVNSLGLGEREIDENKAPGEFRVLALGDSFTEGVGAPYESTWVKALERRLAERSPDQVVTAINAGVSGSDPFYEFILLRERLLSARPDLVIVAINHTDVNNVIMRGDMRRFQADGSTLFVRQPPWWEWAYATSFVVRLLIHDVLRYNWMFIQAGDLDAAVLEALGQLRSLLADFQRLAQENSFELLLVFHPADDREVASSEYAFALHRLVSWARQDGLPIVDLLEVYRATGVMTSDTAADFYWPLDGHHNARGYEVMGNAIADALTSR